MRTQVRLFCPFHRDLSWLTQEVIEDYAGAKIRGGEAPYYCITKWTGEDKLKAMMLPEMLDTNPDFERLQEELIDEFGIEHFIGKTKPKEYHIRQLEIAIELAKSDDDRAKLYKELREYRGWTNKPAEKAVEVNITNNNAQMSFDRNNLAEVERAVMSFFG